MKRPLIILSLLIATFLTSCDNRTIHTQFYSMPLGGWAADSSLNYQFRLTTQQPIDILFALRHNQSYPYQNLWLFTTLQQITDSTNTIILRDTVQYMLADERGRWHGSGFGKTREYVCLYTDNLQLPDTGLYQISLIQAMREEILTGIEDVGVIIEGK